MWLTATVLLVWQVKQFMLGLDELDPWTKVSMVELARWLVPTWLPELGAAPPMVHVVPTMKYFARTSFTSNFAMTLAVAEITCVFSPAAFAGVPPSFDPQGLARSTAAGPIGLPVMSAPLTCATSN